jgi:hypothetical protein
MAVAQEDGSQSRSIREVTDAEVDFYRTNGWVKLDQLISTEFAAELLDAAKKRMGASGDKSALRPGKDLVGHPSWHDYHDIAEEDEVFAALGFSKGIGRAAQRFLERDVSVRVYANMLAVKLGKNQGPDVTEYARTEIHQDFPTLAFDRNGYMGFWIALDEVTPEMGSLQFYTGSHLLGSLGRWFDGRDLLDVHPNIERDCPLAPPLHLQPGDATVHHGFMVHGARENLTDRPRWAYVIGYFPGDTRFTGALTPGDEHLHDAERYGLTVGEPFDHPAFHLVYP